MKMILLFSHQLTPEQRVDAQQMGVQEIVEMPADLKNAWGNVPADKYSITMYCEQFWAWVGSVAKKNDYVLIQGDMGAVVLGVGIMYELGLQPVYATTQRKVVETQQADGTILKQSVFKHVMFRGY